MGIYTDHTDTDRQTLKPRVAARIRHRLSAMPEQTRTFRVTRNIISTTPALERFMERRFDFVTMSIRAVNGAEACRIADEAKYSREQELGHHQG